MFLYEAIKNALAKSNGVGDTVKQFFVDNYDDLFHVTEYAHWKGLITEVLCSDFINVIQTISLEDRIFCQKVRRFIYKFIFIHAFLALIVIDSTF